MFMLVIMLYGFVSHSYIFGLVESETQLRGEEGRGYGVAFGFRGCERYQEGCVPLSESCFCAGQVTKF